MIPSPASRMASEPTDTPSATTTARPGRATPAWRWLLLVAAAALLFTLAARPEVRSGIRHALAWIERQGPLGMVVFVAFYVLATVLMVPGSLLTFAAGTLYGLAWGIPLVSLASTLGATAAFLVARHLARDRILRRFSGNARFLALDQAVAREGWKIVGLTRLSPLFPFVLLNYFYGLSGVALRHYVTASWLGMLPGGALYVYLGSLVRNLADLGTGTRTRTPVEWFLFALGLIATLAVTLTLTRLARQVLSRRLAAP